MRDHLAPEAPNDHSATPRPGQRRRLIELDVECIAAPGRLADLDAAIAQCDAAIANRPAHGDSAWTSLATARDLLAGRRARLRERKRITKDGEIVIEKPHHPGANAHRTRPLRFVVD